MSPSQLRPKSKGRCFSLFFSFFLGVSLTLIIVLVWPGLRKTSTNIREVRQGGYRFINPLLECESSEGIGDIELTKIQHEIEELIDDRFKNKLTTSTSVYFRDLNNGPWFGINENENFTPASLLKVPIMIAYLKQAETEPSVLEKIIKYKGEEDKNIKQNIITAEILERGKSYTIEELLYRMIAYSDNNVSYLLLENIDQNALDNTYRDLGIDIPDIRKPEDFMSVKTYASFFRILFNASYLSKEMSEKALRLLSKTQFKHGLVAGVPSDIEVAHKFGERKFHELEQLHDCGIVYYPQHPYLLCVMTRGDEFPDLGNIIKDISYLVYKEVEDRW